VSRYPHVGRLLGGHYQLLGGLGAGGCGAVYLAEDVHLGRIVAAKLVHGSVLAARDQVSPGLSDRARRMFLAEARKATLLQGPDVVHVLDVGEEDGAPYLVMEYVAGPTLRQLEKRHGPVGPEQASRVVHSVCGALEELHHKRLVHRDLKPHNVVLPGGWDRAKLVDFGLAKDLLNAHSLSGTSGVLGTPSYMAPEQFPVWIQESSQLVAAILGRRIEPRRWGPADHRADLYALGVTVYQMLTGKLPFRHQDVTVLGALQCYAPPEPPSALADVPPAVDDFVLRCLAKAPEERPRSAAEADRALRRAVLGEGTPEEAEPAARPTLRLDAREPSLPLQATSTPTGPSGAAATETMSGAACEGADDLLRVGLSRLRVGDLHGAVVCLEAVRARGGPDVTAEACYALGLSYETLGDADRAVATYTEFLERTTSFDPRSPDVRVRVAALAREGD